MSLMLREWLAPLIDTQLRLTLAELQAYVPGTHLQNGNLTCSPDSVTVHLKKKKAIQVIGISDSWTSSPIKATASDGTGCICATFEQGGVDAFQKTAGRTFQSIKGAIITINDYHLIFSPNADSSGTLLLNVKSFSLRGSEGSKTFGAPSKVVDKQSLRPMLGKLRNLLLGQSKGNFVYTSSDATKEDIHGSQAPAAAAASQLHFNTQIMTTQPLDTRMFSDEKQATTFVGGTVTQLLQQPEARSADYGRTPKRIKISQSNGSSLSAEKGSALELVPSEKYQEVSRKLESKFNKQQSQSSDSSHSVKSTDKRNLHFQKTDRENRRADLDRPSKSGSNEDDELIILGKGTESEMGEKSVTAIDAQPEEAFRLLFTDSFQATAPFEGIKRVPRKYVRIPMQQHALLNGDCWFKPKADVQSALLPGSTRRGLSEFFSRKPLVEEPEEDEEAEEAEEDEEGDEEKNNEGNTDENDDNTTQSVHEQSIHVLNKNRVLSGNLKTEDDDKGAESDPDEVFSGTEQANDHQIDTTSQISSPSAGEDSGVEQNWVEPPRITQRRDSFTEQIPANSSIPQGSDLNLAIPIAIGDLLEEDDEDSDFFPHEELPSTAINKSSIVQVDRTPYVDLNLHRNPSGASAYQNLSSSPVIPATHVDLSPQLVRSSLGYGQTAGASSKHRGILEHQAADSTSKLSTEVRMIEIEGSTNLPTVSRSANDPAVEIHGDLLETTRATDLTASSNPGPHQPSSPRASVPLTKVQKLFSGRRKSLAEKRRLKEERFWEQNHISGKDSKLMAKETRDEFFADLLKHKPTPAHQSTTSKSGARLSHSLPLGTQRPTIEPAGTPEVTSTISTLAEAPVDNESLHCDEKPPSPSATTFEHQVAATIPPMEQSLVHDQQFWTADRASDFDHTYHIPSTDVNRTELPTTRQTSGTPDLETSSSPIRATYSAARELLDDHQALAAVNVEPSDAIGEELTVLFSDPQFDFHLHDVDNEQQSLAVSQDLHQDSASYATENQPEVTQTSIPQPLLNDLPLESTRTDEVPHRYSPLETADDFEQQHPELDEPIYEENFDVSSYVNFQLNYPEYTGSRQDFTLALVYMEWLSTEGKIVNTMLCDEFIRFYPEDYNALNGAKMLVSGWELFNRKVKDTSFKKQVITVDNFQEALLSLDPAEVGRIRAMFNTPELKRPDSQLPPDPLNAWVQASPIPQQQPSMGFMNSMEEGQDMDGEIATIVDAAKSTPLSKKKAIQRQPFFETASQAPTTKRKEPATVFDPPTSSAKRSRKLPWSGGKEPENPAPLKTPRKATSRETSSITGIDDFLPRSHRSPANMTDPDRFRSFSPLPNDANRRKTLSTSRVVEERPKRRHSTMSTKSTPGSVNVGPNPLLFRAFMERQVSLGLLRSRSTPSSTPSRKNRQRSEIDL